ncbi:MAG: GldG family protein [Methylovulum sp.]|uniref:GldG family protein n=1 Tax=Methylovulum sp. TaxID=1916980 RepID=UPI0026041BD3|nr:GldG family protein [Methylovulum sp.]MDD2723786.1 GldG family protein [Methylovulum sp.]MDD5123643.1 GldG family protein [Methylovulum sp.]
MNSPNRRKIALKNSFLTLAILVVLAGTGWLSTRYPLRVDITAHANNTLSEASQKLLAAMPDSIKVTAYLKKGLPLRLQIAQLLERYRRHKPDITFDIIDPDSQPEKTRELEIGPEGAVLVDYRGHTEKLTFVDESTLSNALLQLLHAQRHWVSFLTGHGERTPDGIANFAWGRFGKELALRNITTLTINLATVPGIPDNSAVLVVAAPTVALLPGEIGIIKQYIQHGGNLLLLSEPDNNPLAILQEALGIHQQPGKIIDNSTRIYGIDDPGFVIASSYPSHPITRGLQLISLYPMAAALGFDKSSPFQAQALLETSGQTPSPFAYALTRNFDKKQQRIVVIGDSDFLSNAYLGNVGNLDVGMRIINWLMHNDEYIDIPTQTATDKKLELSAPAVAVIGFGFLLGLPLLLLGTGFIIWRKRKQR